MTERVKTRWSIEETALAVELDEDNDTHTDDVSESEEDEVWDDAINVVQNNNDDHLRYAAGQSDTTWGSERSYREPGSITKCRSLSQNMLIWIAEQALRGEGSVSREAKNIMMSISFI